MVRTSKSRLIEIISNFKDQPIVVAGDMILDRFIWGRVERISPEAPVPVIEITKETVHLGGAANVANSLVSLGARPVPLGVIGTDEAGRALLEEFARLGIATGGVICQESRVTTVKTRIVAHNQQVCRADHETRTPVVGECLKKLMAAGADIAGRCSAVILSDYMKGLLVAPLVDSLVEASRTSNIFLAVDPKAEDFCVYRGASIITPNKREAERASGFKIVDDDSLVKAGDSLLQKTGAEHILITRGEEGMTLIEKGHHFHLPTLAREVFDVTGAGDTVIATLTLAVAAGATVQEAAHLANHAAGIVVAKVGTASANTEELLASLENHAG